MELSFDSYEEWIKCIFYIKFEISFSATLITRHKNLKIILACRLYGLIDAKTFYELNNTSSFCILSSSPSLATMHTAY
jgi:hypothetical protein